MPASGTVPGLGLRRGWVCVSRGAPALPHSRIQACTPLLSQDPGVGIPASVGSPVPSSPASYAAPWWETPVPTLFAYCLIARS